MNGEFWMGEDEKSISTSIKRETPISLKKEVSLLSLDGIHQQVFEIAEQWMARHYILDTESLYMDCMRQLKDHGKNEIAQAINDLLRKKILVNGAALTREKVLDNQNRARILALIKSAPGIHFSRIMEALQTDPRTLQWHLKMLVKFDFIREERFNNKHMYFDFFLDKSFDLLYYYCQKEGCTDIFRVILDYGEISFSKLLDNLKLPRTTLTRRVKMLIEANLIFSVIISGQLISLKINNLYLQKLKSILDRRN